MYEKRAHFMPEEKLETGLRSFNPRLRDLRPANDPLRVEMAPSDLWLRRSSARGGSALFRVVPHPSHLHAMFYPPVWAEQTGVWPQL